MFKVKKRTLLLALSILWTVAGVNILRIGILSYGTVFPGAAFTFWQVGMLLLSVLILTGFGLMFRRVAIKYTRRILAFPEAKKSIFCFMSPTGYLLVAFMMGLGIGLRVSGLLPTGFFAIFYSGLGTALLGTGVFFFVQWIAAGKQDASEETRHAS